MTRYEKNLKVLSDYYPQMDSLIEEAKEKLELNLEIFEELSDDGNKILRVKKGDRICYLNGKRNTTEAAQMWVQTLGKLPNHAPVFIMGVGNFMYLQQLVEQTKNRITIIVYEPSLQIFLWFLKTVDIERWLEKHVIIFWVDGLMGMDGKNLREMIEKILKYEMLVYSRNLILPNYDILFAEEAVQFIKICRDVAHGEVLDFNTKETFSTVMVKNLLSNAVYLCDGYKTTQLPSVIPRDIPGILVAAGPSLNKNIMELKKAKGKAFIIAVDTAIKPLLQAGIKPDMFAIVDAMKPLDLVKLEEARNIPMLTTLNAASEILQYHTGMKFFYNEGYQFAERIFFKTKQKMGTVPCGGSVATSIFSLMYMIGLERIILVGQDLAYTNNKSHADGTFHEVMQEVDTSHFIMVEGNYEDKVPTRGDFKVFLDWYNYYIEGCQEHDAEFRVINATEGGAKIKNTEIMTLKEAIEKECTKEVDIQECLEKLPPMLDEESRKWTVNYLQSMPEEFKKVSLSAKSLKKLYQKLDRICNRKHIDTTEYINLIKKLEKEIEDIEKRSAYQLISITMSNASYILRNEQFLQEDSLQKEGKEIARKGVLYIENVEKMAILFEEVAKEAFAQLT